MVSPRRNDARHCGVASVRAFISLFAGALSNDSFVGGGDIIAGDDDDDDADD